MTKEKVFSFPTATKEAVCNHSSLHYTPPKQGQTDTPLDIQLKTIATLSIGLTEAMRMQIKLWQKELEKQQLYLLAGMVDDGWELEDGGDGELKDDTDSDGNTIRRTRPTAQGLRKIREILCPILSPTKILRTYPR